MAPLPYPEDLDDLLEVWRQHGVSAGNSQRTIDSRAYTVAKMARNGVDPLTATTDELAAWISALPVTRASVATYRAQLRAWYAFLMLTDRRRDDPTARLAKQRAARGLPRPLTEDAVAALLAACGDPRAANTRAYVVLACFAGLRVHEIAKVRGEDLSDTDLYVVGKGKKPALVPLHPRVADFAREMPTAGWWFPSPSGAGPVSRVSVGSAISRAMRRAGVAGTPHACRHYFATSILRVSDIYTAQSAMRHSSVATTAIYAQLPSDRVRSAIARVGEPALPASA